MRLFHSDGAPLMKIRHDTTTNGHNVMINSCGPLTRIICSEDEEVEDIESFPEQRLCNKPV